MTYTVHQAKTHLSRLLKEVEAGQEITILRGKKPVAKLVAVANQAKAGESSLPSDGGVPRDQLD